MVIVSIILGITVLVLAGHILVYRRQVAGLCRQLAFINQNMTQAQPQVDINAAELQELTRQICVLNDRFKQAELTFLKQDEALRETIANLSHDIRTPLTSMDGYFQLLTSEGITQDKKEYYAGIIRSRLESLTDMLDELFTYAKLQDPNYDIEVTKMDIAGVTAETLLSFYDDIRKTGDEPRIDIPDHAINIECNKGAYTRIVQNIIKNALMHGRNLSVKLFTDNDEVVFVCSDEMLAEDEKVDVSRVFERFYKADKARTTKGSGLGLAISKELTEKMGGRIDAKCENGEFAITLMFPVQKSVI